MQENCGRPSVLVQDYRHSGQKQPMDDDEAGANVLQRHSPIRQKGPSQPELQQHLPVGVQCPFLQCLEQAVISSSGGSIWRWHSLGARGLEQLLEGGEICHCAGDTSVTGHSYEYWEQSQSERSSSLSLLIICCHCLRPSTGTLAILICPTEQQHTYHLTAGLFWTFLSLSAFSFLMLLLGMTLKLPIITESSQIHQPQQLFNE